ncbi:MAG: hypothetical protein R2912_10450 [Eubacteriales bacterium]
MVVSGNYSQSMEKKMDDEQQVRLCESIKTRYAKSSASRHRRAATPLEPEARNYVVTIASKEKRIERIKSTLVKPERRAAGEYTFI